jgi:hypothetical protein
MEGLSRKKREFFLARAPVEKVRIKHRFCIML